MYLSDKEKRRIKFDSKTTRGIFVSYASNNTFRIYISGIAKIRTNCDVRSL